MRKTTSLALYDNNSVRIIPVGVIEETEEEDYNAKLLIEKIQSLTSILEYEKKLRISAEEKNKELAKIIQDYEIKKRHRRTKKELENQPLKEYSEYKSNGFKKAQAADAIRSYRDFQLIQNYFLEKNNVRDWMLWTVGVSLGLRISDLLSIKFKHILNADNTFKERITIIEKKTSKLNDCLITESVQDAVSKYLVSINYEFNQEDYLFSSKKTKTKLREDCGWRIIATAGRNLQLPLNIGSHSMRKSFASIVACVDNSEIDMNTITKIQGLLNHSDQRVTMKYLGVFTTMYDKARKAVSDFVLGKTKIDNLVVGNTHTIDDLFTKLDTLESKVFK